MSVNCKRTLLVCVVVGTGWACFGAGAVTGESERSRQSSLTVDRVDAREIVLRGDDGRVRATLGVDGGNVLRIRASSDKQQDRFVLSVFPDGRTALLMKDDRGRNRLTLAMREDGRPFISMTDNASLILHDDRGRNRAVLHSLTDADPELVLYDADSTARTIRPGGRE